MFISFLKYIIWITIFFIRVKFNLEEGGDLIWSVPPASEQDTLPFFSCETFVVSALKQCYLVGSETEFD